MQHQTEEFADTYEFRSMMDRRRRHVEAHLEGYEKQARDLDAKILRIQDPQKAIQAEEARDKHARKVYALTLGCEEAEVPIAVAAMPLASEVTWHISVDWRRLSHRGMVSHVAGVPS